MPDPKKLKVGDRVRFVCLPEEWNDPDRSLPRDSCRFMKQMIRRRFSSQIAWKDDDGFPWLVAKIRERGGYKEHWWGILESTGWRKVRRRA